MVVLFCSVKMTADGRSTETMRLVEDWVLDLAALPMLGVSWRERRWIGKMEVVENTNRIVGMRKMNSSPRDSLVIFVFPRVLFVNRGIYCTVV